MGKDTQNIGQYIDNELSMFERISVERAIQKHEDLATLEDILRKQKFAIKLAYIHKLLVE